MLIDIGKKKEDSFLHVQFLIYESRSDDFQEWLSAEMFYKIFDELLVIAHFFVQKHTKDENNFQIFCIIKCFSVFLNTVF